METATLLRNARRRAKLTQAQLAERAGTSQPAIARSEGGRGEPTLPTLRRLLYACGEMLELSTRPLPPSSRREQVQATRRRIIALLAERGAASPRLFGSVARGHDDERSDLDLLVEFTDQHSPAQELMAVLGLSEELRALLGFRVDVASPATLRPQVLEQALREAVPL